MRAPLADIMRKNGKAFLFFPGSYHKTKASSNQEEKAFPTAQSPAWSTVCPTESLCLFPMTLSPPSDNNITKTFMPLLKNLSGKSLCINIDWILKFHIFLNSIWHGGILNLSFWY